MIERGALLPGDRIPPVRTLAEQLDLAPNTVARAYRALEDDGWIVGRGRAGTFVTDRLPERPDQADAALARSRRRVPAPGRAARDGPGDRDPRTAPHATLTLLDRVGPRAYTPRTHVRRRPQP